MSLRRSELITYAMCAAALGLGAYVFFDRAAPTTQEQTARAGLLIRVWRPDDVTRVTIDRRGVRTELVREGGDWKMASPRVAHADFLAVTSLLNTIGGARAERSVGNASPSERAAFRLDAPRAVVEIAMKGVTLKLKLGGGATGGSAGPDAATSGTAEGGAYVEVAPYGDQPGGVFVAPPELAAALDRPADRYREPSLVASNQSPSFTRVAVRAHSADATGALREVGVVLERGAHGAWRIPSGVDSAPVRADPDVVNGLFAAFADLKADPFVDDATPVDVTRGGEVEVTLRDGGKLSLAFGGACPADPRLVVVQLHGPTKTTGCVAASTTERLAHDAREYVDRHAFGLLFGNESTKISEIEAVTLERGGAKLLDAERRGGGLHLRAPTDEQVDGDASDRYLRALAAIEGDVLPRPEATVDKLAPLGLAPPAGKVTLRRRVDPITMGTMGGESDRERDAGDAAAAPDDWIQLVEIGAPVVFDQAGAAGARPGKRVVHLRRADDGAVLRVDADLVAPLGPGAPLELRSPNLLDVTVDAISRVTLTPGPPPGKTTPFDLEHVGGVFLLRSPPALGTDPATAGELTRHLATLTCTRWAADREATSSAFGFAPPSDTITVETSSKAGADAGSRSSFVLELGAQTDDGGVFARVVGRDPICVLPVAKCDALLRVPFDHNLAGFDPTSTPRVVVTHGAAKRVLVFNGKTWRDGSEGGASADLVARTLADLVVGLRFEGLAHLGPARADEGVGDPTLKIEAFDRVEGGARKKRLTVGALGKSDRVAIYYARIDGVDATFTLLRDDVEKLTTRF